MLYAAGGGSHFRGEYKHDESPYLAKHFHDVKSTVKHRWSPDCIIRIYGQITNGSIIKTFVLKGLNVAKHSLEVV